MKHPSSSGTFTAFEGPARESSHQRSEAQQPPLMKDGEEVSPIAQLLALGQQEISQGHFRDAQKVLDDLDTLDDA